MVDDPSHKPADPASNGGGVSRMVWVSLPLIAFLGLAVIFAMQLTSGRDVSELPSAFINKPVPQFALEPLQGLSEGGSPVPGVASADLTGTISLVNIFASWCAPCRAEHPVLLQLAKDESLQMVGINYKDEGENARRFLGTLGNPYDRVGVDRKGRTAIEWGFYGIPETLLVDAKGIVRHKIVGPITAKKFDVLKTELAKLRQ